MSIHPSVERLNFSALKAKMLDPIEGNGMSEEQVALTEREYRRFLSLRLYESNVNLVPNRLIDEFWHAHILDTEAYVRDCKQVFGGYLHHYPYLGIGSSEARGELEDAFVRTKQAYERHFGPYPATQVQASRCEGHACHAPTPCRCRVPGVCQGMQISPATV